MVRIRLLGVAAMLVACCAACSDGPVPSGEPDVTATVSRTASTVVLTDVDDEYFRGMALRADTPVVDGAGDTTTQALRDGDRVRVWIDGGCAESYPVRCTVAAVQVVDGLQLARRPHARAASSSSASSGSTHIAAAAGHANAR